MYNATEQFAELNQANVAQATKLAALALENVEKLAKVNLLTAKSALAQGVENAQAVAAVKDVQQLCHVERDAGRSERARRRWATRRPCTNSPPKRRRSTPRWSKSPWAAYTKGATAWVDKASKSAPAGSEAAVNAFKQGFAASTAAFDQFNQASKQVVSLADASVRAAAANATKVVAATRLELPERWRVCA